MIEALRNNLYEVLEKGSTQEVLAISHQLDAQIIKVMKNLQRIES